MGQENAMVKTHIPFSSSKVRMVSSGLSRQPPGWSQRAGCRGALSADSVAAQSPSTSSLSCTPYESPGIHTDPQSLQGRNLNKEISSHWRGFGCGWDGWLWKLSNTGYTMSKFLKNKTKANFTRSFWKGSFINFSEVKKRTSCNMKHNLCNYVEILYQSFIF